MTERSRRGLAFLLAAATLSLTVKYPRAEPAERPAAAAPIARVIQQAGKVEVRRDDYRVESTVGSLKGLLTLLGGILRMSIVQSTKAEDFSIRTQTAIASARSTDWIVEARPSETSVFVVSGVVTVADRGQGASVRVPAGEGTSVAESAAGGAAAPKFWGAKRAADALSRTGIE